jgi:hypothetical protein
MQNSRTTIVTSLESKWLLLKRYMGRSAEHHYWDGVGERSLFGPDLIKDAKDKVRLI